MILVHTCRTYYWNRFYRWLPLSDAKYDWATMCTSRSADVTPLLCELQWPQVCFWVQFRVLLMTYKVLHGMGLDYLRGCLYPTTCGRNHDMSIVVGARGPSHASLIAGAHNPTCASAAVNVIGAHAHTHILFPLPQNHPSFPPLGRQPGNVGELCFTVLKQVIEPLAVGSQQN